MRKVKFSDVMDRVGGSIVKRRILIVIVIAVILVASAYGITLTKINSDVMSYLPKGTDTYVGSKFFAENFSLESNAVYAVKGDPDDPSATYDALTKAVKRMKNNSHITDVLWLGSMSQLSIGSTDVFSLLEGGEKSRETLEELFHKDGNYLLIISMNVGASTEEAGQALAWVNATLGDLEYVAGGTAPLSRRVYDDAINELPIYLIVAIVLVLAILFLVSANYLEPLIFMLTMGASIVINMGTNFFFPEVSIITFCAASILQLALAMDYSIFLTQIFSEERARGIPEEGAMVTAIGTTFKTVLASGLTTMGGFAAFFVMSFTLGADLGGVLIKGIFLAMLTVIVLQPCLLILLKKPMQRTKHRKILDIRFKKAAKFSVSHRTIIVILFALLLVPAFLGQYFLSLSYLNFLPKTEGDPSLVSYVSETSNQIFLAAPVDEEDPTRNIKFVEDVKAIKGVSGVAGYYAFLPAEAFDENGKLDVSGFPMDSLSLGKSRGYVTKDGYTMYMVSLSPENGVESLGATEILEKVKSLANETFSKTCYATGVVQAVADFRVLTPRDFRWITIISVAIIFGVLLLTFRNFIYPFLLVLLIELGTWINFSLSTIFGQSLNFLAYIVVGAIQLGATVDYAILVTTRYLSLRKEGKDPLFAAYESGTSCTMSILTSASILIAACASVTIISSNAVIKEITMMCMRGAVISTLLVLFVLPSILACVSGLGRRAAEAGGVNALTKKFILQANEHMRDAASLRKAKRRVRKYHLAGEDEAVEDLETRGLLILQKKKGYRFNSDSIILANLTEAARGETVVDLGCGSGVIGLLVAAKRNARAVGVELQPALADMAKRTVRINGMQDKVEIVQGDVREIAALLPAAYADRVVANPPYYKAGSGDVNGNEEKAIARHEITVTLADILAAMKYLLKEGGVGYIILPCEREKEADKAFAAAGLSARKKTYLTSSADKSPSSFITECVAEPVSETETRTLVTKNENGEPSEEVAALYRS